MNATETTTTLNQEIETMLTTFGVTWQITFIGNDCPLFCADREKPGATLFPRSNHIHGEHYQLVLRRDAKAFTVDYWNSYADACAKRGISTENYGKPLPWKSKRPQVTVSDVLSCCEFQSPGSLDDFCSEFDYDSDSRKALAVYDAVVKQARDFSRMFTAAELDAISEKARSL